MAYINGKEVLFGAQITTTPVNIVQETGDSETAVMSQKATTEALENLVTYDALDAQLSSFWYELDSVEYKIEDKVDKDYFDEVTAPIADNTKRIENLESILVDFPEDNSKTYEKAVPVGVGENAVLLSVKGRKGAPLGNNWFNPKEHFAYRPEYVRDDDAFAVRDWGAPAELDFTITLPAGTYYISGEFVDGYDESEDSFDNIGFYTDVDEPNAFWVNRIPEDALILTEETTIGIYVEMTLYSKEPPSEWFEEHTEEEWWEEVGTPYARIMLSRDEPKEFEKFAGWGGCSVTKIESYGSNRFDNTKIFPDSKPDKLEEYPTGYYKIEQIPTGVRVGDYNQWTTLTPEQFLAMTGLKEGDTFTFSANVKLVSGQWNSVCGCFIFYTKSEQPHLDWGGTSAEGKQTFTRTIPTTFNNKTHGNLHIFSAHGAVADITEITITKGGVAVPYEPYSTEPIDTFKIPSAIQGKNGYGKEGFVLDLEEGITSYEGENTDVTDLLPKLPIYLKVRSGGRIRYVNELGLPVEAGVGYTVEKEG